MTSRFRFLLSVASFAGAALIAALSLACGSSPINPGPVAPPQAPPATAVNTPPVIDSITPSVTRTEVDTDVTLTAVVHDAETAVSQLRFDWKADAGTFTGSGATVTWRAPKGVATPVNYTIKLTVTETFGTGGSQTNVVDGTAPAIRVHDSPKELGDLSVGFLTDFANSSVSPSTCVNNFSANCKGRADEKADIESNREHFVILNSSLQLKNVRVASSGLSADMTVGCSFTSRIIKCDAGDTKCVVGSVGTVAGNCTLTGVYEQQRWWLCESHFSGSQVPLGFKAFFSRPE